jgi:hypothetical protein
VSLETLLVDIRDQAKRIGEQIGMQRGEQIGMHKGQVALLVRLLQKRFGHESVTPRLHAQIEGANAQELETWTLRVVDAPSIQAVFRAE